MTSAAAGEDTTMERHTDNDPDAPYQPEFQMVDHFRELHNTGSTKLIGSRVHSSDRHRPYADPKRHRHEHVHTHDTNTRHKQTHTHTHTHTYTHMSRALNGPEGTRTPVRFVKCIGPFHQV